jgi:hypothetical protein
MLLRRGGTASDKASAGLVEAPMAR